MCRRPRARLERRRGRPRRQRGRHRQPRGGRGPLEIRRSMITDGVAPQASGDVHNPGIAGDLHERRRGLYAQLAVRLRSALRAPRPPGSSLGRWTLADVPGGERGRDELLRASAAGTSWSTRPAEDKLDEIWTFIEFMSLPPIRSRLSRIESTRLPTLKSLYEDDEVLKKLPVAALGQESLENTQARAPSRHSTRICRLRWPRSSTPRSRAASRWTGSCETSRGSYRA